RLPSDFYVNPEKTATIDSKAEIEVDYNVKPLCYKVVGNKLYMRVGETMEEREVPNRPQDAFQRISGMIELRNTIREILDMEIAGCSNAQLELAQKQLNDKYDHFVRNYGILNSQTNVRLFREDADSSLLFACETLSDDKRTATKADVFYARTIRPYVVPTQTDDCFEALQISMNERGKVDIEYVEELTKKDYNTVLDELGDAVFKNPAETSIGDKYSGFETAEKYLSGNVKRKLSMAKTFAREMPGKGFERNVKALESVQPEPLSASDISVRIGASWIDKDYYKQFLMKILGIPFFYEDGISVYYNPHDSSWRIDKSAHLRNYSDMKVHEVYGTGRASAYRIFEDCLNLKATTIYDTVEEDGKEKRVLNQAETIAAREKQNKIKEEFKDWIFDKPERRDDLVTRYNELFNQIRLPTYDGSYLKFPEMNPTIELRSHQRNAVQRIVTGENTLLHHVVGAGKTYTICASCMKLRQYGLAKKPMIVVPNHLVQQWAGEFRLLYPNSKLLIAGKEDLEKSNRKRFVSKVALGDWDAVIIAQSSFAKIPISSERQERKLQEEIRRIEETIASQWEENSHPRGAVKNLERIKKNREAQLKKLMDDAKKDDVLIFENLGVDYLFIDEAHNYKNLFL
ncbi:MAG: DEAD/DEAH box helicase family protein, partial [Phascolarctobacterium sp.]|nr:DEAD/DEAH box helicase family protein [Phascolarctobacterium sp.]